MMRITDIFLSFPSLILCARLRCRAGRGPRKRDRRDRAHLLAADRPSCAGRDADVPQRRLHLGIQNAGRVDRCASSSSRSCPMCMPSVLVRITLSMASVILTAAGLGFPRPRRPAAAARMGRDDRDRPQLHAGQLVARHLPGPRHPARSALPSTCSATACAMRSIPKKH